MQGKLVRQDGRPIIGIGGVIDVEQRDGQTYVHVAPIDPATERLLFVLACELPVDPPEDKYFAQLGGGVEAWAAPRYAFVANIQQVRRVDRSVIEVEAEHATIDTRRKWVAEGECLALYKMPTTHSPVVTQSTKKGKAVTR